ncbi:2-oxohept-3-enedioate hydratase [Pseudooceanicola nitratireducens]|jgi:2-oxo-hept-3-ene-1,7-dioate hydratase|uniref:2-oxohept-3-enedioate hydratase n=1 Tax=Pseudooceanicola nitratireducens TaxID=517719 RepID=A0A1I1PYL1_9RHOB|nr:2-oxo-hepta-3-ene-1,7-dioic acid hydratase [Pseudooceanicola nitratireducens]SEJ69929.1 2-oxo-hept-3-ene-1,7-dioate hydratase [Pseudooceanicola nitratireducens]SFD14981.1 2-oxohept-3-enedioate hydratase [Pseudooceanicola nitratireducens]
MTPEDIETAAATLLRAEYTGQQIGLLSMRHPDITLADAYAIQSAQMAQKLAAGRRIIGWKIGLTSKVMQEALKIDTPDSGVLYDDMLFDTRGRVPAGRFIQPRVEAEIAFVMRAPLEGEVTRDQVLGATAAVVPSLEILDTRILRQDPKTGQPRVIFDTVADNAANAGLVLGAERHAPDAHDLRWTGAILRKNDEVVATGLGAAVLNDPVMGIVWLARRMGQYGQRIEAGQVILSGSFIAPVECPPGTVIDADFGPFGQVAITFD